MNELAVSWAAIVLLAAMAGVGCVKERSTLPPPPAAPNPPPRVAADPVVRVQTLGRLTDQYARTAHQLPGDSPQQHRKLMAEAFAQIEQILPILQGPNPGAEFRQQLQTVSDAQGELATGPQELSPEPTIDTALRATRDALSLIAHGGYYDRADLTPLFDRLNTNINHLDTVRGALHQLEAGEAVEVTSQIVSKMSDALSQRLAELNAASQPASQTSPAAEAK